MSTKKFPRKYNLMKITIWCALCAPFLFEFLNWLTGLFMMQYGIMDRWPIFAYIVFAFLAGSIIQKLEFEKPDFITRLFLMMCWILASFMSSLFWESFFRETPKGIEAVKMLITYPSLITGICFAIGLSVREAKSL